MTKKSVNEVTIDPTIGAAYQKYKLSRCNSEKVTVIFNPSTVGNMGRTTVTFGVLELMLAAGISPVLISAEKESVALYKAYGTVDEFGQLISLENQVLGEGVCYLDLAAKDGAISSLLFDTSIAGRDVIIDSTGGSFDAFVNTYSNVENLLAPFEDTHRFVFSICMMEDLTKSFQNLNRYFEEFNSVSCDTEIHLVINFLKGKIGNKNMYAKMVNDYTEWKKSHQFANGNITLHEIEIETRWADKTEIQQYFASKGMRTSWRNTNVDGSLKTLAPMFLAEIDRQWSKIVFEESDIKLLAENIHPTYHDDEVGRNEKTKLWGRTLLK